MSTSAIVLEKGLPANLDAERFVLGSILLDDSYFIQTAGALQVDDFSVEKHRRIFARMQRRSAQAAEFFRMPGRGVVVLTTAVEL